MSQLDKAHRITGQDYSTVHIQLNILQINHMKKAKLLPLRLKASPALQPGIQKEFKITSSAHHVGKRD